MVVKEAQDWNQQNVHLGITNVKIYFFWQKEKLNLQKEKDYNKTRCNNHSDHLIIVKTERVEERITL